MVTFVTTKVSKRAPISTIVEICRIAKYFLIAPMTTLTVKTLHERPHLQGAHGLQPVQRAKTIVAIW